MSEADADGDGFSHLVEGLKQTIDRMAFAYSIDGTRCESPIERDALIALHRAFPSAVFAEMLQPGDPGEKVIIIQQFKFERYRLDFAIFVRNRRICLECDGRQFHEGREVEDAQRDEFLRAAGFEVVRLRGRDLYWDADAALYPFVCLVGASPK